MSPCGIRGGAREESRKRCRETRVGCCKCLMNINCPGELLLRLAEPEME